MSFFYPFRLSFTSLVFHNCHFVVIVLIAAVVVAFFSLELVLVSCFIPGNLFSTNVMPSES